MGSVKKYLCRKTLPERERHHSRLFVDLAENIHIHYRDLRLVFSLDEYFEFADILSKSTADVRNFLHQNPDYAEQKYPTTIMIAGGKERQLKFLKNSPKPNETKYMPNDLAIELQDEFVTDEIHVHYRDMRLAFSRDHFRMIAKEFAAALSGLDEFEKDYHYKREHHNDRAILSFNSEDKNADYETVCMGSEKIRLDDVKSHWYTDIRREWKPKRKSIEFLKYHYSKEGRFFPILLSTEDDGRNLIIDGHHRYYAALELGLEEIDAIISDLTFEGSEKLRKADILLKEFDYDTDYKYNMASISREYAALKLNRHYKNLFAGLLKRNTLPYRVARRIKRKLVGKRQVFKDFFESHNN